MTATSVRLLTNTGILMGMELGVRLFDALVAVILARYLAPEGFGLLAFAVSFSWLFSLLPGFGMWSLTTRDIARAPEHLSRYLSNGLAAKALLACLTLAVIWLVSRLPAFPSDKTVVVMVAGLVMILETTVRYTLSFFQAAQRMSTVALVNLAVRLGWIISSLAVIGLRGGVMELLGARAAVTGVALLVAVGLIDRRLQRVTWALEPAFIRRILVASFPFALFYLYGTFYSDIATVLLSMMRGDAMAGWYAAAQKFVRVVVFIPSGFFGAMLPAMSRFSRDSRADLLEALARSCKYLLLIGLPIAGGTCMLADRLVPLLFGSAYQATVPVLRVLSWSIPLTFVNWALVATVMSVNRERRGSAYLLAGVLFAGLGNLIAIPLFGCLGASVTTLLAEALTFMVQLLLLRQSLPEARPLWHLAKPLWATLAMAGFVWAARGLELPYTVLGSAAIYLTALVALRAVGPDEWTLVNGIVRRKGLQGAP
jgi:PST family polysaccharide transporter